MAVRRSTPLIVGAAISASSALWPLAATAGEAERVRLRFGAPESCGNQGQFLDEVARDGGRMALAADDEPARSFSVAIEVGDSVVGHLVVLGADGSEARRTITGEGCADVVRSLAVLVALSLQPTAPLASAASAVAAPEVPAAEASVSLVGPSDHAKASSPRWRLAASAEGTLSGGAAPQLVPGLAAYVELLRETPSFVAPSVRLGVEASVPWTLVVSDLAPGQGSNYSGSAFPTDFERYVARLDACPVRLLASKPWLVDAFSAQPCLRIDAGQLTATRCASAASVSHVWVAAEALLRLRWQWPRFFFEGAGGLLFPISRERVFIDSGAPIFETPVISGTLGLGMGALFL